MKHRYEAGDDVWTRIDPDAPVTTDVLSSLKHTPVPAGEHAAVVTHISYIIRDELDRPCYGVYVIEYDQIVFSDEDHLRPRDSGDKPERKPEPPKDSTPRDPFGDKTPDKKVTWEGGIWKPNTAKSGPVPA